MSDTTIPINVWLGGRSYRIRIHPDEEEQVRKAVKYADDKIIEFRNSYAGKDDQDFMAMVLLLYALEMANDNSFSPVAKETIQNMIQEIDKVVLPENTH